MRRSYEIYGSERNEEQVCMDNGVNELHEYMSA